MTSSCVRQEVSLIGQTFRPVQTSNRKLNTYSILLLSGYHAASHRYWCDQLQLGLPDFDWTVVTLPDRHFYWRIRSNALTFASRHPELMQQRYDLVVATSMVDLCNLRGLLPHFANVPTVLYFHENQFAYPQRKPNSNLINAQLTTVYSAMSAQHLLFNSRFNRESFFAGAEHLFEGMPDGVPRHLLDKPFAHSSVIPVPVCSTLNSTRTNQRSRPLEIVWNHRWEYDKQPQVFFGALEKLINRGTDFKVHVMGQSFRQTPECFTAFHSRYGDYVATWGYQPHADYQNILQRAHLVVSSALHDFQGLGMLEAIAAGCIPIAPDRMAYPEYIPGALLYSLPQRGNDGQKSESLEVDALFQKLCAVIEKKSSVPTERISVDDYFADRVMPLYRDCFSSLIDAPRVSLLP